MGWKAVTTAIDNIGLSSTGPGNIGAGAADYKVINTISIDIAGGNEYRAGKKMTLASRQHSESQRVFNAVEFDDQVVSLYGKVTAQQTDYPDPDLQAMLYIKIDWKYHV